MTELNKDITEQIRQTKGLGGCDKTDTDQLMQKGC